MPKTTKQTAAKAKRAVSLESKKRFPVTYRRILALFIISGLILYFRRTDAINYAQFWAEDGAIWYQTALDRHFSLSTLFTPYAGYLGVFPRLVAVLAGPVNLVHVPLFFNIIALLVQMLPVFYLWSRRYEKVIPSPHFKIMLTATYLLMPYMAEIHGTITNSQWFLALIAFMILFIGEPIKLWHKIVDYSLLFIATISGPFSVFLLPIVAIEWYVAKENRPVLRTKGIIIGIGALIQVASIIFGDVSRVSGTIGFSFTQSFNIIGGQIFGAGLFGEQALKAFSQKPWIAPIIAVIGVEIILYAFIKGPRILKYLLFYGGVIFAAALFSSPGKLDGGFSWWQLLGGTISAGGRYYFMLHLAVFVSLLWIAFSKKALVGLRISSICILILSAMIGIPADFKHEPYKDLKFKQYVKEFEDNPKGQDVEVPINPGGQWKMVLRRD